jgi:hypothetical protein
MVNPYCVGKITDEGGLPRWRCRSRNIAAKSQEKWQRKLRRKSQKNSGEIAEELQKNRGKLYVAKIA